MKYLDTGSRNPADSLYKWLENVLPDATYVGAQTGYFSFDGVYPLQADFESLLQRGGTLHLVVGANEAGIRRADLEDVLDLFDMAPPSATTSLTLVAADDVLMHPKTYYVEKANGTKHAFVGSANLTHPGLSRNIEAALVIDSTTDPNGPFPQIRAAIDGWHSSKLANAYAVDRTSLAKLVADGVLDVQRVPARVTPRTRKHRSRVFPGLGAFIQLPRRKRNAAPGATAAPRRPIVPTPVGTLATLPNGAVGVLKSLSRLDVKAFHGGVGTAYIALPIDLAGYLPMVPCGKNGEPRVEVSIEARLEGALSEVAISGPSSSNITHVGKGATRSSHGDLRFNYLTEVRRGIEDVARANHLPVPGVDDLAAIEFLDGVRARITFIIDPASIANLTPLLDQGAQTWGWLPGAIVASWDTEVDA